MNLSEELGETMNRVGSEFGQVYPAMITLLCWMLQNKYAPRMGHLMWLLHESDVDFEQEMYFTDRNFKMFSSIAYDWLVEIGGFYND